ncbi:hypothetical protein CesoFtcFv8_000116 [Champsocephalus esox]|uniref:TSC22 domain family protein 3 n=2 Tax=Champsocephalus esox TaxID=159716 RepID=A0AAN8E008_9TELE|nr:hypothetical protein CesoFtcFv8_000116 [Champsocephalus esox]
MFGVKKMTPDPPPCPRPLRRHPSTPPLPLRMLKLVAKQPEMVVLRERRRVRGHVTGSRESWPGAAPPPAASHWSVPVRAPPSGRGSEASMMSLMLLCHSRELVAIDNKIEQAMDLVKSHLMLAVREEVELLKDQIRDLRERNQNLERENLLLRALTHTQSSHSAHNTQQA